MGVNKNLRCLSLEINIAAAFASIAYATLMIGIYIDSLFNTFLLILAVHGLGAMLIVRISKEMADPRLTLLIGIFSIKIFVLISLVTFVWAPGLDASHVDYGYDPQRYYHYSLDLLRSGFDPTILSVENLNYVGIVYYYSLVFMLFGENFIAPVLVNALITLYATVILIKFVYSVNYSRSIDFGCLNFAWLLGVGMILPEVLWFDVMTSRETLVMSLVTISSLNIIRLILNNNGSRGGIADVIFIAFILIALALVRPPVLVAPLLTGLAVLFLVKGIKMSYVRVFSISVVAAVIYYFGNQVAILLGSSGVGLAGYVDMLSASDSDLVSAWRETEGLGQFAKLLIPNNIFEAVIYVPFRLMLYLISPLGVGNVDLEGLIEGNWVSWQFIMMALSAAVNLICFPYFLSLTAVCFKEKNPHLISYCIATWVALLVVAGGNFIVHDRYRVMATLLLFGGYWLGYHSPLILRMRFQRFWFCILLLLGIFYLLFKLNQL